MRLAHLLHRRIFGLRGRLIDRRGLLLRRGLGGADLSGSGGLRRGRLGAQLLRNFGDALFRRLVHFAERGVDAGRHDRDAHDA